MKRSLFLLPLLFIVMAACKTPQKIIAANSATVPEIPVGSTGGSEKLYAGKWILYDVDGVTLMPSVNSKPAFLAFTPGQVNHVSGSTGCNNLTGTFELSGTHSIQFSPLGTTRMMCPPDGNNKEERLLKALKEANNYYFTGSELILANGSTAVAKFKPEQSLEQK